MLYEIFVVSNCLREISHYVRRARCVILLLLIELLCITLKKVYQTLVKCEIFPIHRNNIGIGYFPSFRFALIQLIDYLKHQASSNTFFY